MTIHTTHLTSEELPEPGELRRVISVHGGNRTYETVPVGHESGWLVASPHSTNPVYWTDDEVSEVHDGWVVKDGYPAAVLSRHGHEAQPQPQPRFRRSRRARVANAEATPASATGADAEVSASEDSEEAADDS